MLGIGIHQTSLRSILRARRSPGGAATAPQISGSPLISGTTSLGETLSVTPAPRTGTPTPTRTLQWQRNDGAAGAWQDIAGETSSSKVVLAGDVGYRLRVAQTETNTAGSDQAFSAQTAIITAPYTGGTVVIDNIGPQVGDETQVQYTVSADLSAYVVLYASGLSNPTASNFNTGSTTGYIDLGTVALTLSGSGINVNIPEGLVGTYKLALLPVGAGDVFVAVSPSFDLDTQVPAGNPFSITKTADLAAISNNNVNTPISFTGVPIGDASADREVYVSLPLCSTESGGSSVTGVTIGGVAASSVVATPVVTSGYSTQSSIWKAVVPTGTTADIVVTVSARYTTVAPSVFEVKGRTSEVTNSATAVGTHPISADVNTLDGGAVMVAGFQDGSASSHTLTPTGYGITNLVSMNAGTAHESSANGWASSVSAASPRAISISTNAAPFQIASLAVVAVR